MHVRWPPAERGTGMVGYNVQTVVDAKHHMIVAHEVTNVGHDRDQLSSMAHQARDAIGLNKLTVLADRGYFKGEEIFECEQAGIKTLVPKPQTYDHRRGMGHPQVPEVDKRRFSQKMDARGVFDGSQRTYPDRQEPSGDGGAHGPVRGVTQRPQDGKK
jgi:hypothetical protein